MSHRDGSMFASVDLPPNTDQLEARLQNKLAGRIRHLQLSHRDGGLILRGFASTYHAKQLAQHAVMMETNVPILSNEIEVC